MLTERTEQRLEILPDGVIQVQNINIIERDGKEVTRTYHRHVVDVEDSVVSESDRIKAVADVVWTADVKVARALKRVNSNDNIEN